MEHVYNRRKRQPLSAPENPPVREERPVCTLFERCKSCPYPRHGFICWNGDESCLRTDMQKIDSITRLNNSDRLYYIGGENGL